jgi:hypothetical protein
MNPTPPPDFLPVARANAVLRKLRAAFAKPAVAVRFSPSHETASLGYFPAGLDESFAALAPPGANVRTGAPAAEDDIAVVTAHGADVSAALWQLRVGGFAGALTVWAWDNHVSAAGNLATAIAADVAVPSHGRDAAALNNPVSIRAPAVHACAAQWRAIDAGALFERLALGPRSDRLFASFVDYGFRDHATLLRTLARDLPEAEVRLMPPEDRKAYFGKRRDERFADWASRKVSLVLPVSRDLSTRVFDALLAGQTLVVPPDVADLDVVIPRERQRELGIVRFARPDPAAIREAWREALAAFDAGGPEAARRRHEFVRGAHMLEHRVAEIVGILRRLASGALAVRFGREPDGRPGLIAEPAQA